MHDVDREKDTVSEYANRVWDESDDPTIAEPAAWHDGATVEEMLQLVREQHDELPQNLGEVASGGMAHIFSAHDPRIDRRVAMKVIRPEVGRKRQPVAWFIREAHVTGQLDHPNIVPVHDLGVRKDGLAYFTMKLVEGKTLQELVDGLPSRPLERGELLDMIEILLKVCDALAFAHSRAVIHTDVKPSNVMVGDFGEVYLMDWGIARLVGGQDSEEGAGGAASDSSVVASWVREPVTKGAGSPGFVAPEQARGQPLDERADVFGVGALLYYILGRRPPYVGQSLMDIYALALEGKWSPLADVAPLGRVPAALERIVEKAMAVEPEERFPTMAALHDELKAYVQRGGDFPIVAYEKGELIIEEGESADAAYVIVGGRCEVFTHAEGRRMKLARLGRGDVFGETALMASSDRTASVVALEKTSVVRIPNDVFEREMDDMKPWMGAFTRALARRFRTQMERTRTQPALRVGPSPDLVLLTTLAWATDRSDAAPAFSLVQFATALRKRYGFDREDVVQILEQCSEILVDEETDQVAVRDICALAVRLREAT